MYVERKSYHNIEGNKKSSINFYQNFKEYVTDRSPTDHQQLVDSRQTDPSTVSTGCQPAAGNLLSSVGRQLANSWPTVGRQSVDRLPTVGQLSLLRGAVLHNYPNYLPPISRWSFIYY